ncbi:MAG: XdhC/CoxI family protein [Deltaproteobacteria bacterium]|nr:XdhC/CoxI family protein [Deltaproteobacteria bacterium]
MSFEVLNAILDYLKKKRGGCLATIIKRIGSSPREEGTTMFIGEDGKIFGTIGGGTLEKEVKERTSIVLTEKRPEIFPFRMDAKSVEDEGMLCGGNVEVLIEPVLSHHLAVYERAKEAFSQRKEGIFYIRFDSFQYLKTFVEKEGSIYGDDIEENEKSFLTDKLGTKKPIVIERSKIVIPLRMRSVLYIFGAGHISRYLVSLANLVDFVVTVIDDSNQFAKPENFPEANRILAMPFEDSFRALEFTGEEFVVIVTRGHKSDAFCLEEVLKRPFRYVGMIGSKRKVNSVFEYLKGKGYGEDLLRRVHAPIGLEINSETPQEVAISIVAQLIKERGEYLKNVR